MYAMTIKGRSAKELQTVVSRLLGRYNTHLPHSILSPHSPSRLSTVSTLPTPPHFTACSHARGIRARVVGGILRGSARPGDLDVAHRLVVPRL